MSGRRSDAAGVSHWWPTPARPSDHFTAAELSRSADLHGPVRRVRMSALVARAALLVAGSVVVTVGPLADRLADAALGVRAAVGAIVVVLAFRLPEPVARRRLSRLPQVELVAGERVAPGAVAAATAGPILALTVVASALLGRLVDPSSGWLVVAGSVAVALVAGIVSTGIQVQRVTPLTAPPTWERLVERSGAAGVVEFGALPGPGSSARLNACALGYRSPRRILVSPAVLHSAPSQDHTDAVDHGSEVDGTGPATATRPAQTRPARLPPAPAEFVVAHELHHLAGRHPEAQLALGAVVVAGAVGAVAALGSTGWPWSLLGADPSDPAALPLTVLVAVAGGLATRIPVAWALRGLERVADGGAIDAVGVPGRADARGLLLGAGAELAPPRWSRLLAGHPAPAQRLEYLARRRSAAPGSRPG